MSEGEEARKTKGLINRDITKDITTIGKVDANTPGLPSKKGIEAAQDFTSEEQEAGTFHKFFGLMAEGFPGN